MIKRLCYVKNEDDIRSIKKKVCKNKLFLNERSCNETQRKGLISLEIKMNKNTPGFSTQRQDKEETIKIETTNKKNKILFHSCNKTNSFFPVQLKVIFKYLFQPWPFLFCNNQMFFLQHNLTTKLEM